MVCEYGCWVLAAFAGGGDAEPEDYRFQEAVVEAGALEAVANVVDSHRNNSALRR